MHRINENEYIWAMEKEILMKRKKGYDRAPINDSGERESWPWLNFVLLR